MTGRLRLTKRERASLLEKQEGRCITCKRTEEEAGPFDGEHTVPNFMREAKPDALMCRACHKWKTAKDRKAIAKVNRLLGVTRRGSRKTIRSRGFDTRYKLAERWR